MCAGFDQTRDKAERVRGRTVVGVWRQAALKQWKLYHSRHCAVWIEYG